MKWCPVYHSSWKEESSFQWRLFLFTPRGWVSQNTMNEAILSGLRNLKSKCRYNRGNVHHLLFTQSFLTSKQLWSEVGRFNFVCRGVIHPKMNWSAMGHSVNTHAKHMIRRQSSTQFTDRSNTNMNPIESDVTMEVPSTFYRFSPLFQYPKISKKIWHYHGARLTRMIRFVLESLRQWLDSEWRVA